MELICLGDSLTFGYGVKISSRWTSLTAAQSGWKLTNMGISGDTSGGMMLRLNTQIMTRQAFSGFHADRPIVLIMGGCNDIFYSGSDISARANIGAMIHQLRATGSEPLIGIPMKICASGLSPEWSSVIDLDTIGDSFDKFFDWIEEYCKGFKVRYVDFRPDFTNPDGSVKEELYLDGLHPNEKGHELMAARLVPVLKSLEK